MGVAINIAWTKNEGPAELEGILAGLVLPVAGSPGPFPGAGVVAPEEMEQGSGSEAYGAIGFPLLVD